MALTDVLLGKGPRPGPDTKERQRRVVRRRKRNQFGMDWGGPVEKKEKKRRVGGYWVVVMATGICVCAGERAREPGKGKNKHTTTRRRRKKGKRCTSHVWERQRASDPKKGSRYSIPP